MKTTPYKLKTQQIKILQLLYQYRFLNRPQIQQFLYHKSFNRIIVWLNDLTEHKYVTRNFSRKIGSEPAIYSLNSKARKVLKDLPDIKPNLLNRIYKEKTRSLTFRSHCLLLGKIALSLQELADKNNAKLHFYTKTDLEGMEYLILPTPDAYFALEEPLGLIKRYFLDVFDPKDPRMWYRKRIRQYFTYYDNGYWQDNTGKPFPEIILVCADETMKRYAERFIKKMRDETGSEIIFYLSGWDEIQKSGISKSVLLKA